MRPTSDSDTGGNAEGYQMRPLFTIHAGEYLAGLHVQKTLKLNAWIPAKDRGPTCLSPTATTVAPFRYR